MQETRAQLVRWLIRLRREPFSVAFNLVNPIILLIFMGGAFEGIMGQAMTSGYREYLLAGILALTAFGNSMGGGIALLFDKENGFLLRLMSAPISRGSILVGRFLAVNINTVVQCLLIILLGLLFGIRVASGVGGVFGLLMMSMLLGFGVTVISLVLAFVLNGHGDFFAVLGITVLPLTFLSSAFVPLESMPAWMSTVAWVNPVTYAVDGMRSLILGGWDGPSLLRIVVVLLVFDAAMFVLGNRVLKRHLA
ncbi:MAG: ABC transporter permease [Deltaproteobacteria bacterium]|nr:ABC transporter permease [Deltaproteobacteria bacterium]